ncbi:MAG: endonuclease/exonuclease/phosphatase family protein [Chitinivibrionales bacterium]|nr:endonuclease/exonuclease/phosphatase family protein [Chitinivibrionales bacterium]
MLNLRIVTINIHKGFSWSNRRFVLHRLREAIRSTEADIVFLQEVAGENSSHAQKHPTWPDQAQHEFLADSVWSYFAYGKNAFYPNGHHGNAVLSKFPILRSEQIDSSTNRIEQRGFLYCGIKVPNHRALLHCLCIHQGLFAVSRRKQLRMQADYINRHIPRDAPLIMAGDFNDWRGRGVSDFASLLGLSDAAVAVNGRRARTFPARIPMLPLDRIYIRGLTAKKAATYYRGVWRKLSDHASLIIESELP